MAHTNVAHSSLMILNLVMEFPNKGIAAPKFPTREFIPKTNT